MAKRVAGTCFLKADGNQYPLRGNFTVSPSRLERAGIAGLDRVHGYSENPRVPFIEGDVTLDPALSIEALEAVTDATITAQLANGKTYTLFEAWTKAAFELNGHDGMVRVRFEGTNASEF